MMTRKLLKKLYEYCVNIVQQLRIVIKKSNIKLWNNKYELNMAIIKHKHHTSTKAMKNRMVKLKTLQLASILFAVKK